jgi:prepilin-type N-terminal cleavage/methylation domain-containing protein
MRGLCWEFYLASVAHAVLISEFKSAGTNCFQMQLKSTTQQRAPAHQNQTAFTLVEVMMALAIFGMIISGLIFGYVQANRMAEWSSMSLAAQSFALQGVEQARSAKWEPYAMKPTSGPVTGLGTSDEWPATNSPSLPYVSSPEIMDIPAAGGPNVTNSSFWVTNYIYVTTNSINPPLRQIQCDCHWTFPLTKTGYTNTVITLRSPNQQ